MLWKRKKILERDKFKISLIYNQNLWEIYKLLVLGTMARCFEM